MRNILKGSGRKFLFLYSKQLRLTKRDSSDISGLAESIRLNGLLSPIVTRRTGAGYEIICGARRYRACIEAGLRKIPCLVVDVDDKTVAVMKITDNIHHKDLDIFILAEKVNDLMRKFNISYHEAAGLLGMSQPELVELLGMLRFSAEERKRIAEKAEPSSPKQSEERQKRNIEGRATDPRLYINSLNRITDVMRESGFNAKSTVSENGGTLEFNLIAEKIELGEKTS